MWWRNHSKVKINLTILDSVASQIERDKCIFTFVCCLFLKLIIKALKLVFQLNSKGSNYWLKTVDIYNLFCTKYNKEKAILIFFYHELSLNLHQSKSVLTFKCPSSSNTSMVKILTIHEIFLLHVLEVYVTFISHF